MRPYPLVGAVGVIVLVGSYRLDYEQWSGRLHFVIWGLAALIGLVLLRIAVLVRRIRDKVDQARARLMVFNVSLLRSIGTASIAGVAAASSRAATTNALTITQYCEFFYVALIGVFVFGTACTLLDVMWILEQQWKNCLNKHQEGETNGPAQSE